MDGKQAADVPVATAAVAAKPGATAAPAQPAQTSVSPTAAQTAQQAGTGAHSGAGSEGHGGSAGQPGAAAAGTPTAGQPSVGAQPASLFSLDAAGSARTSQTSVPQAPASGLVRTSVHLQEAVDAVRATFTAANSAGVSSARISLEPASLGGIKISLSQTPDGLVARVATDHPEAAQTLQQSAGELRRSLESSGMSLLRLDIGSAGQQSLGGFSGSEQDGSPAGSGWSGGGQETAEGEQTPTQTELTIELTSGSLVNVLA